MPLRLLLSDGTTIESDTPQELRSYLELTQTSAPARRSEPPPPPPEPPPAAEARAPRSGRRSLVPPSGYEVIEDASTIAVGQELLGIRGRTGGRRLVVTGIETVRGETRIRVQYLGDRTPGIRPTSRMAAHSLMGSYFRRIPSNFEDLLNDI